MEKWGAEGPSVHEVAGSLKEIWETKLALVERTFLSFLLRNTLLGQTWARDGQQGI